MVNFALLINVAVFGGLLAFFLKRTSKPLYSPLFWYFVFHFIVFVVRPVLVLHFGFDFVLNYMKIAPSEKEKANALYVALVGLVAMNVGYYYGARKAVYTFQNFTGLNARFATAFTVFAAIATPLVMYSMLVTSRGVVGDRIGGVYVLVGTTGYIIDAQLIVLPLTLLFLVATRFSIYGYIPLFTFLAYAMIFGRVRWMLVVALIAGYLMFCQYVKRRITIFPLMVVVPVALAVFAIKGLSRDIYLKMMQKGGGELTELMGAASTWKDRLDTLDFANYDYLVYITSVVPKETGTYTKFTQWLQLFTEPVPRMLWSNKPVGPPIQYFDLNDYGNFIGLTNSIVGDGWMSYGFLGVIVTCLITGWVLGSIFKWICGRTHDPILVCAYCIFCALTIQLYRDGGISIFKFCLFAVIPLLVLRWWAGDGGVQAKKWVTRRLVKGRT